jgi:nucleoside-diphosphate-sugar epimerase
MNILITGASGFIGGFLVKEALNRRLDVWAGVRKSSNRSGLQDKRINFVDLNYGDKEALTRQLREMVENGITFDYVIHNAGLTKTTDKSNFYKVNARYTENLAEALAACGSIPKKFILMSSLSSFGIGDEKKFTPIRLTDPQRPNTEYGKSKLEAEQYIRKQKHFPYVILRPTGVYGPGEKDYFMEIKSVAGGVEFAAGLVPQQITFIYVKDLANVALDAAENDNSNNKEYFVADGDVYTDRQFGELIQKILGKKYVFRARMPLGIVKVACIISEGIGKLLNKSMTLNTDKYLILKQRNWICDTEPLRRDLNFKPKYNLEAGLKESIEWYKQSGWLR